MLKIYRFLSTHHTHTQCRGMNPLNPGGMPPLRRANPRSYDEYMKAYSMAMLPGRERENVSYGGKGTPLILAGSDGVWP
jgi:hypothetical protein